MVQWDLQKIGLSFLAVPLQCVALQVPIFGLPERQQWPEYSEAALQKADEIYDLQLLKLFLLLFWGGQGESL